MLLALASARRVSDLFSLRPDNDHDDHLQQPNMRRRHRKPVGTCGMRSENENQMGRRGLCFFLLFLSFLRPILV